MRGTTAVSYTHLDVYKRQGYDKQNTYDEWIEAFDGKVKLLVLIGQTREKRCV